MHWPSLTLTPLNSHTTSSTCHTLSSLFIAPKHLSIFPLLPLLCSIPHPTTSFQNYPNLIPHCHSFFTFFLLSSSPSVESSSVWVVMGSWRRVGGPPRVWSGNEEGRQVGGTRLVGESDVLLLRLTSRMPKTTYITHLCLPTEWVTRSISYSVGQWGQFISQYQSEVSEAVCWSVSHSYICFPAVFLCQLWPFQSICNKDEITSIKTLLSHPRMCLQSLYRYYQDPHTLTSPLPVSSAARWETWGHTAGAR